MENQRKRKQNKYEEESNSVTSPLSKRNDNVKLPGAQETNPIVISEGNQSAGEQKERVENDSFASLFHQSFNDHVPLRTCSCPYEGLTTRITMLETIVLNMKQSIDELKDIVIKNVTPRRLTVPEVKDMGDVLKRFSIEKDLYEKDIKACKGTAHNQSVRKLFTPEGTMNGNTSHEPIITTKTFMGNYKVTPRSNLVGPHIPQCLTEMFHPKDKMKLNDAECLLATYIFSPQFNQNIDEEEIMVNTDIEYTVGTRKLLQCLKPKKTIDQDVIDLVATMLTYDERLGMPRYAKNWFLPSTLSQYVITLGSMKDAMMKGYRKRFMGHADYISKIFVPIHDVENIHWFLLIIDFDAKQLVYLDSFQSSTLLDKRKTHIKKLTLFMEKWLMDPSFYDGGSCRPKISEFKFVTPRGYGSQAQNSNDCAIWVIKWMMQKGVDGYKIKVDEGSRLQTALQLIMHPYNKERDLILKNSLKGKHDAK